MNIGDVKLLELIDFIDEHFCIPLENLFIVVNSSFASKLGASTLREDIRTAELLNQLFSKMCYVGIVIVTEDCYNLFIQVDSENGNFNVISYRILVNDNSELYMKNYSNDMLLEDTEKIIKRLQHWQYSRVTKLNMDNYMLILYNYTVNDIARLINTRYDDCSDFGIAFDIDDGLNSKVWPLTKPGIWLNGIASIVENTCKYFSFNDRYDNNKDFISTTLIEFDKDADCFYTNEYHAKPNIRKRYNDQKISNAVYLGLLS